MKLILIRITLDLPKQKKVKRTVKIILMEKNYKINKKKVIQLI